MSFIPFQVVSCLLTSNTACLQHLEIACERGKKPLKIIWRTRCWTETDSVEEENKKKKFRNICGNSSQAVTYSWTRIAARSFPLQPRKMWNNCEMITGSETVLQRVNNVSKSKQSVTEYCTEMFSHASFLIPWNCYPGLLWDCTSWHSSGVHPALHNSWRKSCLCLCALTEGETLWVKHPAFPKDSPSYECLLPRIPVISLHFDIFWWVSMLQTRCTS